MNQDIQIRQPDGIRDLGHADPALVEHPQVESPIYKIHRALRRRYKWALLLGAVLGAGGAVLGYKSGQMLWSSSGMVQVRSVIQPIVSNGQGVQPDQGPYVQTQVAILKSQRVAESALQSAAWKALGRHDSLEDELTDFMRGLVVNAPHGSEMIQVSYTDTDPNATTAAVKGVLSAYEKIRLERDVEGEKQRRRVLEERRDSLTLQLNSKRDLIQQTARQYGTDDLGPIYSAKLQEQLKLEEMLAETKRALSESKALTEPAQGSTTRPAVVARLPKDMTPQDIAAVPDIGMRQMLAERDALEKERFKLVEIQKLGENHPSVMLNERLLSAKLAEIDQYATHWRANAELAAAAAGVKLGAGSAPVDQLTLNRQILENKVRLYGEMAETAKNDALKIGRQMLDIKKFAQEAEATGKLLDETKARLDQMDIEARNVPRVEIMDPGSRPLMIKDSHKNMSIAGGIGGFGLGFGLVLALSLLDRRFRSPLDAQSSGNKRLTLLGVLPSLPDDLADPEQAAMAAHCVHQIRTLLQIGGNRHVFSITSPAAGTGKTSLTLAMGVSFAAASCRVLMIDCDVVGGGLSVRVNAIVRRRIGQILRKQGLLTQQHFEEAMRLARHSQKRIGEVLVEMGRLAQHEVDKALSLQDGAQVGLLDALAGESLEECVAETGIENLSILPLGQARPGDVSKISPVAISNLIGRAREHYDIVVIDTGPVPGSLEASSVAAAVDGVVLIVSRGEHRPLAERSIQHLRDIGAPIAGIVFNRAENRDIELASTTVRLSSMERNAQPAVADPMPQSTGRQRFGPMATAVANRSNPENGEDGELQ